MLFIDGPINKQNIEIPDDIYKFVYKAYYSSLSCQSFSYPIFSCCKEHYYYKESIDGQYRTFFVMRNEDISIDKMIEILTKG